VCLRRLLSVLTLEQSRRRRASAARDDKGRLSASPPRAAPPGDRARREGEEGQAPGCAEARAFAGAEPTDIHGDAKRTPTIERSVSFAAWLANHSLTLVLRNDNITEIAAPAPDANTPRDRKRKRAAAPSPEPIPALPPKTQASVEDMARPSARYAAPLRSTMDQVLTPARAAPRTRTRRRTCDSSARVRCRRTSPRVSRAQGSRRSWRRHHPTSRGTRRRPPLACRPQSARAAKHAHAVRTLPTSTKRPRPLPARRRSRPGKRALAPAALPRSHRRRYSGSARSASSRRPRTPWGVCTSRMRRIRSLSRTCA
jgi:hypothetical protein